MAYLCKDTPIARFQPNVAAVLFLCQLVFVLNNCTATACHTKSNTLFLVFGISIIIKATIIKILFSFIDPCTNYVYQVFYHKRGLNYWKATIAFFTKHPTVTEVS